MFLVAWSLTSQVRARLSPVPDSPIHRFYPLPYHYSPFTIHHSAHESHESRTGYRAKVPNLVAIRIDASPRLLSRSSVCCINCSIHPKLYFSYIYPTLTRDHVDGEDEYRDLITSHLFESSVAVLPRVHCAILEPHLSYEICVRDVHRWHWVCKRPEKTLFCFFRIEYISNYFVRRTDDIVSPRCQLLPHPHPSRLVCIACSNFSVVLHSEPLSLTFRTISYEITARYLLQTQLATSTLHLNLSGLPAKAPVDIPFCPRLLEMGQQHVQNENFNTERQAVLTGLNAQIEGLDMKIADLMAEHHILERAREHILSVCDAAPNSSDDDPAQADSGHTQHLKPTYPPPSYPARKAPSCLCQEVLIRNAWERENNLSPPGSAGLISSNEFEAAL
jgi:hypothetical protein